MLESLLICYALVHLLVPAVVFVLIAGALAIFGWAWLWGAVKKK